MKLVPLSLAERKMKNEVENSSVSSSRVNISGDVLSRPVLLHTVVFMV